MAPARGTLSLSGMPPARMVKKLIRLWLQDNAVERIDGPNKWRGNRSVRFGSVLPMHVVLQPPDAPAFSGAGVSRVARHRRMLQPVGTYLFGIWPPERRITISISPFGQRAAEPDWSRSSPDLQRSTFAYEERHSGKVSIGMALRDEAIVLHEGMISGTAVSQPAELHTQASDA